MKTIFLCLISLSLLSLLPTISSQLVRMPLNKNPKKKTSSDSLFTRFTSFSGSMSIDDYSNAQYVSTIKIGSPSEPFTFMLDTGSCNLWIPDSSLAGTVPNAFDCSDSSTCVADSSDELELLYGTGQIQGYKATDQIEIGGLAIPQFEMILATYIGDLPGNDFDGLIGLGLGTNLNFPTVLQALQSNGLISVGMFSLYLGNYQGSSGSSTGEIIFGGYDPKYAASDFQFINLYPAWETSYWAADMISMGYGNVTLTDGSLATIFDSGTSLMVVSQGIFDNFLTQANAAGITFTYNSALGVDTCSCSAKTTLSNLTFAFNGANFNISATNYIISSSSGGCYLGMSVQTGYISLQNPVILGDAFLNNYYALFTADNTTLGLADAVPYTHFPVWAIILIVIGSLGFIGLCVWCYQKRKRERQAYRGEGRLIGTQEEESFRGQGREIGTSYDDAHRAQGYNNDYNNNYSNYGNYGNYGNNNYTNNAY